MPEWQSPRRNHLIAALPSEDYRWLLPRLEPCALPVGLVIHEAGERESHLYFPTAGLVSRVHAMDNGGCAEFALTGSEGVIGLAAFLGGKTTPSEAFVLSAGHAYRVAARDMEPVLDHEWPIAQVLLRYTLALIAQTGQLAACNRHHSLEQRLCRWILSSVDRMPSNEIAVKQEIIARVLGVRREGVSQAAARLQRQGLIRYSRGHIAVVDRRGLEAHACECYGAIRREYARLLPASPRAAVVFGTAGSCAMA